MDSTQSGAKKRERLSFGSPCLIGFDYEGAGAQLRRLLLVNLHARRQAIGCTGTRFRLILPVTRNGVTYELPIDNHWEVSVILRHMCHLPIQPVSLTVSRRRAAQLIGQSWLGGV